MVFLEHLQQKLKDLYREFPSDISEIKVNMKPDQFTIETNNDKIVITTRTIKKINFSPYLTDLITSDLDFDFGLYVEKDLTKLLQYINLESFPNGKKLLAYSLFEENFNELIKTTSRKTTYEFLKQNCNQNTRRIKQIAKRANRLLEITGEFPIRLTSQVTPRWLYNLNEGEFEEFLQKCNRINNLELNFAGAQ
jgi:hypothetical protein